MRDLESEDTIRETARVRQADVAAVMGLWDRDVDASLEEGHFVLQNQTTDRRSWVRAGTFTDIVSLAICHALLGSSDI